MFSWFRKKKPEQPVAATAADIELVRGEVAFANHQGSWSEPYDTVDALRRVLGARGLSAGKTALVRYVPTWPDCGFEFRKQYALLHAPQ